MKLFIPTINSELVLKRPLEVSIFGESRNRGLLEKLGVKFGIHSWDSSFIGFDDGLMKKYGATASGDAIRVTLPKGLTLKVSRIYIRNGAEDFDSLTFNAKGNGFPSGRFWLKLTDVNRMEVESPEDVQEIQKERHVRAVANAKKREGKEERAFLKACQRLEENGYTWEDVKDALQLDFKYDFIEINKESIKDGKASIYHLKLCIKYINYLLVVHKLPIVKV